MAQGVERKRADAGVSACHLPGPAKAMRTLLIVPAEDKAVRKPMPRHRPQSLHSGGREVCDVRASVLRALYQRPARVQVDVTPAKLRQCSETEACGECHPHEGGKLPPAGDGRATNDLLNLTLGQVQQPTFRLSTFLHAGDGAHMPTG